MMVDTTQVPRSDWEYFSFSKPAEFVRIYQEGLPRVFEPVFVVCSCIGCHPMITN